MNLFLQVEKKLKVLEQKRNIEVTDDNWRDYDKARYRFVVWGIKNGATLEQLACLLDVTKQFVWQLNHYGLTGLVGRTKRVTILERDGYKCQLCNKRHRRLHIHHKHNPKSSLHNNLISLCPKCHKGVHMGRLQLPVDNLLDKSKV